MTKMNEKSLMAIWASNPFSISQASLLLLLA